MSANNTNREATAREQAVNAAYSPLELTLDDSGQRVTVTGLKFRDYVVLGRVFGPFLAEITAVSGELDAEHGEQLELLRTRLVKGAISKDEYEAQVAAANRRAEQETARATVAAVLRGICADADATIRLMAAMSDLTENQISELSTGDGAQLLEACASRIKGDDVRRFFQATARMAGAEIPGTG